MKKFCAIFMAICLMASALSISTFAAGLNGELTPIADVLTVSGLTDDGKTIKVSEYVHFDEGWNAAIKLALDDEKMEGNKFERVVVDLHADWHATDGEFSNSGVGFDWDAIYFPEDVRVTLNMNGHTIDRGLKEEEDNGEVMCIDENADVIINNGTITGGCSDNGAGGIHVKDNANVTLNDVNIVGNIADFDDGGGIALYSATLTMNGGSFKDNAVISSNADYCYGGAIYANKSNVTLKNVTFENNQILSSSGRGGAIYADGSNVSLEQCTFNGNGILDKSKDFDISISTIHCIESEITVKKSTFTNNGCMYYKGLTSADPRKTVLKDSSSIFLLDESTLTMEDGCKFSNNTAYHLIRAIDDSEYYISDTTFTNNDAYVLLSVSDALGNYFRNCYFNKNIAKGTNHVMYLYTFYLSHDTAFYGCDLRTVTFNEEALAIIEHSEVSKDDAEIGVSLIFKDGTTAFTKYYQNFEDGWDVAMETAASASDSDSVIVDLYADWNTNDYGVVSIPNNIKITINMNGHKIDRAIEESELNGEVMYISANADVTINDGTITGGFSGNGAGGIHIDGARVTLNNVHVDGNSVEDDDGAAMALYNNAILIMDGGSISDNYMNRTWSDFVNVFPYGSLYVNNSTATLNNVTISSNHSNRHLSEGMAIYATHSTVTLTGCVVKDNGALSISRGTVTSIVAAYNSKLIISDTDFINNGKIDENNDETYLFYLEDSLLTTEGGKITDNHIDKLFYFNDSKADFKGVAITDNEALTLDVDNSSAKVTMTECTLGNNTHSGGEVDVIVDTRGTLIIKDCTLGDTSFEDKAKVSGVGSMIGEGSIANLFSIVAIVASIVSMASVVVLKYQTDKKKA